MARRLLLSLKTFIHNFGVLIASLKQGRRPRLPHPQLLLALVLALLTGAIALERQAHDRQTSLLEARSAYLAALGKTRTQLAGLLAGVATDKTLAQNLNWRLAHSVQSALAARLQRGGLDQVVLFDQGCREVARAKVGRGAPAVPCPFAANTKEQRPDTFYWLAGDEAPILALLRQVDGTTANADVFAVGVVSLDQEWQAATPALRQAVIDLDLRIGKPAAADAGGAKETLLVTDGLSDRASTDRAGADGVPVAALISSGSLDRWLVGADSGTDLPAALIAPCLVVAFLLTGWGLLRERLAASRAVERQAELVDWAKGLSPGAAIDIPGRPTPEATPETVRRFVTGALKQRDQELRLTARRLHAAEEELKTKELEIRRFKHRLAELAELDSLAVQLARTTKAFLERMERFRDDAQDLGDLAGDGLAPCARLLVETLGVWRDGIEARGARKFLRGLSETQATGELTGQHGNGAVERSRLDEDLALLGTLASELDDQALQTTVRARRLLEAADFAARLAGLWHGIALKTHDEKTAPTSLAQPLEEAQSLVHLEAPGVEFLNVVAPEEVREIPALPRTVWVTALYHVYLAMAELARGNGVVIATRLRKEDDRLMLVVQAAAKDGGTLPRRGDQEAYHLDVSRSIMAPFPVTLTALPSLDGPFPVAISWSREATTRAPVALPRQGAAAEAPLG